MSKLNAKQLVEQYDLNYQHPGAEDVTFVDVDEDDD